MWELGALVYVRAGETNMWGSAPVAQVMTDGHGFDVALPVGTWCFSLAAQERANLGELIADRCAYVARIEPATKDFENVSVIAPHRPPPPCPWGIP
jgi:hypothetical protein